MEFSREYLNQFLMLDNIRFDNDLYNYDYEGMNFVINQEFYCTRLGKKTPSKNGYFLALWRKNIEGQNIPYDCYSNLDYLLVIVKEGSLQGHFKFPKSVLVEKGILSNENLIGKMAFRVYAPWNKDLNISALRTQVWQIKYFIDTSLK